MPDVPAAREVEPGPDQRDRNGDGIADGLAARLAGAPANQRFDVIAAFTTPARAAAARRALGTVELRHEYDLIPGFAARLTAGQVNALTRLPGVVRVEEVAPVHAFLEAERRDFGVDAAQLEVASGGSGVDGSGVGICVVDTGVFADQEQLDGKDITFVDFVGTSLEPYDDQGHGTHVASIAAGDGTAPDGGDQAGAALYRGVAPGASLYAAKVLDANGQGTTDDVIAGVEWCADQLGVRVINLSLGEVGSSDGTDLLSQAVDAAVGEGVVVVVAAGNSGAGPYTISSPAAARLAITVGAVAEWSTSAEPAGESDGIYLAPFSSRGPTADNRIKPDIVAPGVSVIAGYPDLWAGTILEAGCNPECYASLSGTSMAAPFTAGTVALMLHADPTLSPAAVKTLLQSTAQDRGPNAGGGTEDNDWGHGLIDAEAAVAAAASGLAAPTAFPTHSVGTGQVAGSTATQVAIPVDDTSAPLAVAVTILDGEPRLFCDFFSGCFYEWRPDFDVRLRDPNGNIVAEGFCMLGSLYGFECDN
ncbi:MAG TPA: S8 family serine peptidase, partial [Geminicoccaceae bacterium]